MIDIIDFFKQQVELWNEEKKCGFCWHFEYVERLSDLNESVQTEDDECCMKVFLTDFTFNKTRQYPSNDGGRYYTIGESISYRFNLYILANDTIGRNVYNEIKDHSIDESKWATILKPIMFCIGDLDFCEIIDKPIRYDSENWQAQLDMMDSNYSGWKINLGLTEKIPI